MRNFFTLVSGIAIFIYLINTSYAQTDLVTPIVTDFQIEFSDDESPDSVNAVFTVTYSEDIQLNDTFTVSTNYNNNGVWATYEVYGTTEIAVEGNVLTVTPARAFSLSNRYEFIITWRSVQDLAGNYAGAVTRTFVADDSVPEVVEYEIDLTYSQELDSVSAVFTLTYSENVKLAPGFSISTHVSVNGAWEQYDAYDQTEVNIVGNLVTITPDRLFSASKRYELIITFGAITDMTGNMATSFTRTFIADVTAPQLTNFETTFADSAYPDSLDVTFTLTYDEDVQLSNNFIISTHYKRNGVWLTFESIRDTSVMVSGNKLTINPMRLISKTGSYELVVAAGAVKDLAGNSAPAYTNVFLRDSIPPKLTHISPDLTLPVAPNASFVFTFDEDVRLSANFGFYTYYRDSISGQYVELERLNASQAVINRNVITFTPSMPLKPNRRAQIILTASSVLDMEGNAFLNITDGAPSTFVSKRFPIAESDSTFITFFPAGSDSISYVPEELTIAFSGNITLSDNSAVDSLNVDSLVYLRHNGTDLEHESYFDSDKNVITIVPVIELMAGNVYTFGFTDGFNDAAGKSIPGKESTFTLIDTLSTNVNITPEVTFNIYPNPFESYIRISNSDKISRVMITNITGQRVLDTTWPGSEINTSHLVSGVYIISLIEDKKIVKTSRIIKK